MSLQTIYTRRAGKPDWTYNQCIRMRPFEPLIVVEQNLLHLHSIFSSTQVRSKNSATITIYLPGTVVF